MLNHLFITNFIIEPKLNLSEDLFSYFFGYGNSTGMENGYPWVENILFLESVSITAVNTGRYNFSFTGYALRVGKSPVN